MRGVSKAGAPLALRAGAALATTPGPGQPSLPVLAPTGGAAPGHLRRASRQDGWPGLPRSATGCLHRVGEVAAARYPVRGHVDGGPGVGPRHAGQLRAPPLRRAARGRGPHPFGVPGLARRKGDVAHVAERRGGGHPRTGSTGPRALLAAEGGPFPPPAGTGGGPGPPRRVPVPPMWHVLGGPRCLHGSPPGGPTWPRRLPLSGAAASAAASAAARPPHLRRLRWPLAGGHRTPPTATPVGGAVGLAMATGFLHNLVRWARGMA